MGSIGSWYLKGIPARTNETVQAGFSANYLRKNKRPLGGKLYVTSERVIFTCHRIDAFFDGESFERDLGEIVAVGQMRADSDDGYAGGGEPRLRMVDLNGEEGIFIVHKLPKAVSTIDNAVADAIN